MTYDELRAAYDRALVSYELAKAEYEVLMAAYRAAQEEWLKQGSQEVDSGGSKK